MTKIISTLLGNCLIGMRGQLAGLKVLDDFFCAWDSRHAGQVCIKRCTASKGIP